MAHKTVKSPIEEEKEIIKKIRKGNEKLKQEFIKKNQGLVIHIAKKYAFTPEFLPDLIAEGNMGLLRALEKFDFRKKVKFGTYAYFWIKRFVLRAIMKEYEILKIPEKYQEFREKLEEIKRNYALKYGREPTDKEIAQETKLPVEIIKKLKKFSEQVRVISSDFYNGEKDVDLFEIFSFKKEKERELWEILRNKDILNKIFTRLKEKEKRANIDLWLKVLKLHFGLGGNRPHSYKEIAAQMNVSRQRIHQIIKICLKRLRKEWEGIR
ncbi:sigma-70 family RNA polymerase sigma factor, partial [bacterium]|nr:sigma-70 family RNA polymerase sigma factor [bacterium]